MSSVNNHGTVSTYNGGCRCDKCRAAWAAYMREYKRRTGTTQRQAALDGETRTIQVTVTPLDEQILAAAQARTNASRGLVIARLLREHGVQLQSSDFAPALAS